VCDGEYGFPARLKVGGAARHRIYA
jgi:hypothetical protein